MGNRRNDSRESIPNCQPQAVKAPGMRVWSAKANSEKHRNTYGAKAAVRLQPKRHAGRHTFSQMTSCGSSLAKESEHRHYGGTQMTQAISQGGAVREPGLHQAHVAGV
nr:hypothetical protein [Photorhabdus australis]